MNDRANRPDCLVLLTRRCGPGVTGWTKLAADGSLNCMQYAAGNRSATMCNGFEVAYCEACRPCPAPYNWSFHPGTGCPNCTSPPPIPRPPSPPPPPPPPAPPGGQSCLRFGNAIPSSHSIDAEITQGSTVFRWTDYRFGSFSDWVHPPPLSSPPTPPPPTRCSSV